MEITKKTYHPYVCNFLLSSSLFKPPSFAWRKINFTIPDGYVIKNLDDLKIDHTYQENGQTTMGFTSTYKVEGNVVRITIQEEYRRTYYPLSQFEDFKKVINAAADFNKVALVLEKK